MRVTSLTKQVNKTQGLGEKSLVKSTPGFNFINTQINGICGLLSKYACKACKTVGDSFWLDYFYSDLDGLLLLIPNPFSQGT